LAIITVILWLEIVPLLGMKDNRELFG